MADTQQEAFQNTYSLRMQLSEFRLLAEAFELSDVNLLSPLPFLVRQSSGAKPRSLEEITVKPEFVLTKDEARGVLRPILTPDRIIDVYGALFNSAPTQIRLYACRKDKHFVGIRQDETFDRELLFPLGLDNIKGWLEANLQFAGSMILPSLFGEFTGQELVFLLTLTDVYKEALFQNYASRQAELKAITISEKKIIAANQAGTGVADRRWLLTAIQEFFRSLMHIGGEVNICLPELTPNFIKNEIQRYVEAGHLVLSADNGKYEFGRGLTQLAADLAQWISLLCMHDLQITDGRPDKPEALEEVVFFIPTQSTIWTLVSEGLTQAGDNLAEVRFGLRSSPISSAHDFAEVFLKRAIETNIPDDFYQGTIQIIQDTPMQIEEASIQIAPSQQVQFCPKCGNPVPTEKVTKFCRHCGQPIDIKLHS